jgi:Aromatic ring hydroxylase
VVSRRPALPGPPRIASPLVPARERDHPPPRLAQPPRRAHLGPARRPGPRPLLDRFLHGAKGTTAERRARIFRLAWDFTGSALASRGEQYERFYLASSGRAFIRAQTYAAPERARRLIDRFLKEELA